MIVRKTDPKQLREMENLKSELEKQKSITKYVAMMADVKIPIEEEVKNEESEL